MSTKELREYGKDRLAQRVGELRSELLELREHIAAGKEKNHRKLRELKRELARAQTILRETAHQSKP